LPSDDEDEDDEVVDYYDYDDGDDAVYAADCCDGTFKNTNRSRIYYLASINKYSSCNMNF